MGVSVREKVKGSGQYWLFIRYRGERVSQLAGNQETAEDAAKEVRREIRTGRFDIAAMKAARASAEEQKPEERPISLKEFYENKVLPVWEGSLAKATYKSYEGSFRVHILPLLGDVPLSEVSRDKIKAFVATLRKKSTAKRIRKTSDEDSVAVSSESEEKPPRLLSKESIRNIIAALRGILSEAVESNLIAANPAVRLGKFYKEAKDYHEEIDTFSAEEVSLLLRATRNHFGFENYVLLLTLFHCGLRAGEAAGLYWSDFDVRNKVLLVRRQMTRGRKEKPKTRKKRSVDVSTTLLAELQVLKKQRQAEYLTRKKNEIPDSIFLSPGILLKDGERTEGTPHDMNNFRNRVFWKACDKAKIRRRRLHDTRHTFASLLLSNGESLKYVSSQLGHASIRMTADVYGHLEVGANRAAMDRLPTIVEAATA